LRRTPRRFVLAAALLGVVISAPSAHAQTAEAKAGARAAATQGNEAFGKKQWAESLDLFTRAESLMHAPTHVLMIARSHAALGHLVRAHEAYTALSRETLAPNAPNAFKEAQAAGTKELQALEPRVPTLVLKLSDSAAKNVVVTMDGETYPAALIGIARPIDPGTHVLMARGDEVVAEETSIEVAEGAHPSLVLALKPAPRAPSAAILPEKTPAPHADAPTPRPSNALKIAGYAGIGLGVVGLGLGGVFTGLGFAKRGEANDAYAACGGACVNGTSQADDVRSFDSTANTQQTIGVIGLIAGGALAATGVTLLVLSPKGDAPNTTGLWVGPSSTGVKGTF
jgi:hypothetical protein